MISDILTNRNNRIRQIYRRYFSKFWLASKLKLLVFQLMLLAKREKYSITNASRFFEKQGGKCFTVLAPEVTVVPDCKFYGLVEGGRFSTKSQYISQELSVKGIKDAVLLSRSDLVFKGGEAIFPDGYDYREHLCTVEQFGIGKIDSTGKTISIAVVPRLSIEKGISLLGDGAGNYAHYLTEIVPKLIAVNSINEFKDYPFVADGWVGEKLLEVLAFFNDSVRQVILLDNWQNLAVRDLLYVTSPTCSPQDFKNNFFGEGLKSKKISDGYKFSSSALALVRNYALDRCATLGLKPEKFKKIYIKRRPIFREGVQYNQRHIVNDREISEVLSRAGFEIVDVTTIPFEKQVMLFADVDVVVAPLGAALANLIFSRNRVKVIGLSAYYEGADYSYFSKMMAALGHSLSYVVGPQIDSYEKHPMHKKYSINIGALMLALSEVL